MATATGRALSCLRCGGSILDNDFCVSILPFLRHAIVPLRLRHYFPQVPLKKRWRRFCPPVQKTHPGDRAAVVDTFSRGHFLAIVRFFLDFTWTVDCLCRQLLCDSAVGFETIRVRFMPTERHLPLDGL